MKGYKDELVPYEDRKFILENLYIFGDYQVIPQDSLDPYKNLKKFKCTHMASGDGFEKVEEAAAKKLKVKLIKLDSKSKLHSSDILKAYK